LFPPLLPNLSCVPSVTICNPAAGVVVPIPTNPAFVIVVVPVPPNCAKLADSSDDDAFVNLFVPDQKLVSDRSVVEAVESVPVIVIGAEPNATNPVHDVEPEHVTVVVAVVPTTPVEPTYATPCPRDDSRRGPENVDDAVEKNPLSSPSVVDVELYPVTDVNGNALPPSDASVRQVPFTA